MDARPGVRPPSRWAETWRRTSMKRGARARGRLAASQESLRNYAIGVAGARTLMSWCHTLRQFHPTILNNIIVPALRTHDVRAIMWVGKTRVGKSSASKATCLAISAYQIDKHGRSDLKPGVVTAKRIDFFRLEPGRIFKPAIADDAVMSK